MIYLLDVNVLLAVSYEIHDLHKRTVAWLTSLEEADPPVTTGRGLRRRFRHS